MYPVSRRFQDSTICWLAGWLYFGPASSSSLANNSMSMLTVRLTSELAPVNLQTGLNWTQSVMIHQTPSSVVVIFAIAI